LTAPLRRIPANLPVLSSPFSSGSSRNPNDFELRRVELFVCFVFSQFVSLLSPRRRSPTSYRFNLLLSRICRVSPKDSHLRPIHLLGHLSHQFWISFMFVLHFSSPLFFPSPSIFRLITNSPLFTSLQQPNPPLDLPSLRRTDLSRPSPPSRPPPPPSRPDLTYPLASEGTGT